MSSIARPSPSPTAGVESALARLAGRTGIRDSADAWALPALAGVAALAAILYLVNLTVSGYANTYYAMAAQAASQSWSAWFLGSLDASGFITLDKPPLATMVMGLSVRLLGLSSWSILLPEALMGVGAVVVLFLAARRSFGTAAATIAGAVMALTPAAVLIFRYDNPDALLTLLLVSAAWALLRALDGGRMRWLALAGTLVGLGFMTKFLQAWLVLPVFALVWIVAAPGGWRRRVAGIAVSAAAVAVASLAWPVAVDLVPAASRPFIGGSTANSVFDLILGYDGLGRIFGGVGNGGGGGGGGGMFGGTAGLLRLFNDQFGGQVSWLIPYAVVAGVSGLILRLRTGRTDRRLAGYLLWGGWLGVHVLVFSFMSGVIHPYYSVILAPAIGALVGGGTIELWRLRSRSPIGGLILAGALVASGAWAWALLERSPDFAPGLGIAVFAVTAAAGVVVAIPAARLSAGGRRGAGVAVAVALAALLAGPAAYAAQTMTTALSGGDPAAGPASGSALGGGPGGQAPTDGGTAGVPGTTGDSTPPGTGTAPIAGGSAGAGMGAAVDEALTTYLVENAASARWIVAVSGSGTAAGIQLTTGLPVMTMGGFNGSDAAPSLEQLQAYVASGELRYVLLGSGGGGGPSGASTSDRDAWVTSACTAVDSGSSSGTLYDCAGATGG
jgi:4-amino-4-deoxy-L-arabinose transferase-like glycosyltransferase